MRCLFRAAVVSLLVLVPYVASAADTSPRRTISLNGAWQIAEGKMDEMPKAFDREVPVPGLADMATPAFEGVGVKDKDPRREAFWYRRTFKVDGAVPEVARLKIHKACYGTRVYLNGKLVGDHVGCFTPGYFQVRHLLKGEGQTNELVIRVGASHAAIGETVPWGHDFEKIRYVPGIYDSVELILTGTPWIESVQVRPVVAGKAIDINLTAIKANPAKDVDASVRCRIREAKSGKIVGSVESRTGFVELGKPHPRDIAFMVNAQIEGCRLWSPEDPFLYELEVSVLDGQTVTDVQTVRFGMRSFSFDLQTKLPMLNGKPYYLRGTNICIYRFFEDPKRGDKPWREEWVRSVIRGFRSMHWNSCRYCIGFPPEMWYRIADEEGLMIQDEFPVWGQTGNVENLSTQYAEWMRERWNHPSVVIWDAQNETPKQHVTGKALSIVRKMDQSNRPWDNGWDDPQCPTDVYETHPYRHINPKFRMSEFARMSPRPGDPGSEANNDAPNKFNNPIIINEYGWLWLNRDGSPTTIPVHSKSYRYLLPENPTAEQYRECYARTLAAKTEFWRTGRKVAGVMHFCGLGYSRPGGQTSDNFIDIEKPQFEPHFYQYVRDAFAPVGLMLNFWEEQAATGATLKLPVVVINDLDKPWEGPITLRLTRDGRTLAEKTQPGKVEPAGREVYQFELSAPSEPGNYRLVAELSMGPSSPVRSLRDFSVPAKTPGK